MVSEITPTNIINNYTKFRGNNSTATNPSAPSKLERNPQSDVVELQNKQQQIQKNKLSPFQKTGLLVAGSLGTIILGGIAIAKHQTNKLEKLYKENIVFKNLAEHIDFKEATTVEEGIKFAKEVLGIEKVDKDFTLEAINFANKGLIDVSNANKGSLFIPKQLRFMELEGETIAQVNRDVESNRFGELAINKKYFDNEFLTDYLDKFHKIRKYAPSTNNSGNIYTGRSILDGFVADWGKDFTMLMNKYASNANNLSMNEKRQILLQSWNMSNLFDGLTYRAPFNTIKKLAKNLEDVGINVNIDEIAKLSTKEQVQKLKDLSLDYYNKTGKRIGIKFPNFVECHTIYHEMGHLQDFAKNLKNLDIKQWKLPSFKEIWKDTKAKKGHVDNTEIEHVANRWSGLTYGDMKNMFSTKPGKFKKKYPDLYEFLTNQESQQTAGKISSYAQTSIGEFIAETYAEIIAGKKIPEDVMKLYEKYNGPKLNK
jgi:hypothetical protein